MKRSKARAKAPRVAKRSVHVERMDIYLRKPRAMVRVLFEQKGPVSAVKVFMRSERGEAQVTGEEE